MTSIAASLPLELLSEIFSWLTPTFPDLGITIATKPCYPSLRASALVCRAWRDPSQRALFEMVNLPSQKRAEQWKRSTARTRFPTRHLVVSRWVGGGPELLAYCPGLLSLDTAVAPINPDAMYDGGYSCFSKELNPPLRNVYIRNPARISPYAAPLPHPLRSIHLVVESDDIRPSAFSSIFITSQSTLASLHLHHSTSDATITRLATFFSEHPFPNLRFLSLRYFEPRPNIRLLICALPSLTTLDIQYVNQVDLAAIGACAQPGLEELSFSENTMLEEETLSELLRVIQLPTLAALRRLDIILNRPARTRYAAGAEGRL